MTKETAIAFVNDRFVPEKEAVVSIFDRSFLYGDGLFASIRFSNGRPFRWRRHMLRIQRGASFLGITIPASDAKLREIAVELVHLNHAPESILRLTISRGIGLRGYSPKSATHPTVTMSVHSLPAIKPELPPKWQLATSSIVLRAADPLAHFKSCNRLQQVLARADADTAGCDEALLLNDAGHAVETASGNLFWINETEVCTPPLGCGILPGVTRSVIFEVCDALGLKMREEDISRDELLQTDGAFASVSSLGVVEITAIDGTTMPAASITSAVREGYDDVLKWETRGA